MTIKSARTVIIRKNHGQDQTHLQSSNRWNVKAPKLQRTLFLLTMIR